jgi:hypothetical protein
MGPLSIAALALKYPRIAKFLKRFGKWIALALLIAGAFFAFKAWKADLVADADAAGFARAQAQYAKLVEDANKREAATQNRLDQLQITFGALATTREQQITIDTQPRIERITREVAANPRYRECVVSDGVLGELNAARSAVNARVAASSPDAAR